ncbi:MAG: hypothetical protein JST40_05485 [Armatimonadetes bacterium]|nr:hypothetical protein [Armatimonadota bacterium]
MEISLTEFVDFIVKTGTSRMTHVNSLRKRGPYSPATDYYKGLREAIVEFHAAGSSDGTILEKAVSVHVSTHKGSKCPARLEAYRRFLGRKRVVRFAPPKSEWRFDELVVRLNPELGLNWNGTSTVIKLYWKETQLTKRQVEMILYMMHAVLGPLVEDGTQMAILDIPSANLITSPFPSANLMPLLRSEARAFVELWRGLEEDSQ